MALSSIDVEYMATIQETYDLIWMRKILVVMFVEETYPTMSYFYNESCIKLSENMVFHDRPKHIDI